MQFRIVFENNFHGRTVTIITFSVDPDARDNYGPFTPGFVIVPYDDLDAVEKAVTKNTVGILVEPIQGEAGVVVPRDGFLKGLGRFACVCQGDWFGTALYGGCLPRVCQEPKNAGQGTPHGGKGGAFAT